MQLHGIRARGKRRFEIRTDSQYELPNSANLLNREFTVAEADRVWVRGITYIATDECWLFLAVVVGANYIGRINPSRLRNWHSSLPKSRSSVANATQPARVNRPHCQGMVRAKTNSPSMAGEREAARLGRLARIYLNQALPQAALVDLGQRHRPGAWRNKVDLARHLVVSDPTLAEVDQRLSGDFDTVM